MSTTHTITIESLGGLGDGIGTLDGKPVFIPKSCAGDVVRARIVHENRDGYQALIEEVVTPGADRAAPPCQHFSECGGCTMQQLNDTAYRNFKTRIFHSALANAGRPMPEAEVVFVGAHSRRRAEFKLKDGKQLAFHALRSHTPVALDTCLILEPALHALIAPMNAALSALPATGAIKSISLTAADRGTDMLVEFRDSAQKSDMQMDWSGFDTLVSRIAAKYPDERMQTLSQSAPVEMQLGNYAVTLPPDAFLQATREGQRLLTQAVLDATKDARTAVDLFCGIGSYSFPLCDTVRTHAIEGEGGMVKNLQTAVQTHGIDTLTAEKRDLFKQPLTAGELRKFDAAILNPPRAGAKAQTEALAASNVGTVVMVSCNPASFARDAKTLLTAGFKLESAFGVDQFVWSPHLEIVAVFRR